MQARTGFGGNWGGRDRVEGGTVGHCGILEGMGVGLWRGERAGWVDLMVVIPGCVTSGRSVLEVHFSHILRTFWGSFTSVLRGVGSLGRKCWFMRRWWILGQSRMMCSAVSSPIPHFLQMVSTACHNLCSHYLSSGCWPLLRRPIVICSFLDNYGSSQRLSFSPFMPYTP